MRRPEPSRGRRLLNATDTFDVTVIASDGSLSASDTFRLTITPVNDAPVAGPPIGNQSIAEDTPWTFQVPASTFADVDSNLTYSATMWDGSALPAWLTFDAATHTFAGTPPQNFNGSIDLKVTASDGSFDLSDTFTLTVTPVNDAPAGCPDPEPDHRRRRSLDVPGSGWHVLGCRQRVSDLHGDSVGRVGFASVAFFRHGHCAHSQARRLWTRLARSTLR